MTARRIVVAVLALASLTVGMYAQGGARRPGAGARAARAVAAAAAAEAVAVRLDHLNPAT